MASPGAPRSGGPAPARRPVESGGGTGNARSAHAGSLPVVQGVQSRSTAAVQMARAHRGACLGRAQPQAMLWAVGAGSPAERSAFRLRAGATPPLPSTRPRFPPTRFASWFPSKATLPSLSPCPGAPLGCGGSESGLGRPAGRRDERAGRGGAERGPARRRQGGRVPGSPAPMGREAGAGALCRSHSRAATPARGKEPYPHPCVVLGAACCARPPASALGSLGTKVEPLVHPLSQAPETVAVHHQGTWKTKDLGHKSETRQRLRKSTSPP